MVDVDNTTKCDEARKQFNRKQFNRKRFSMAPFYKDIEKSIKVADTGYRSLATMFNEIRVLLSDSRRDVNEKIVSLVNRNKELEDAIATYRGLDTEYIVDTEETCDVDVENGAAFDAMMEYASNKLDHIERMRKLAAIQKSVNECIDTWKSKADKMEQRLSLEQDKDSPEYKTSEEMSARFRFKIENLEKRANAVSVAFFRTRESLLKSVKRISSKFDAKFTR